MNSRKNLASIALLALGLAGCTTAGERRQEIAGRLLDHGIASYYHEPQGTASGERFNPNALTAAHKTLPLGSKVRIVSRLTGYTVDVRINDRGPYVKGRVIDLSRAAAERMHMIKRGTDLVSIYRLDY